MCMTIDVDKNRRKNGAALLKPFTFLALTTESCLTFRPEGNDRYVMFAPDNPKKVKFNPSYSYPPTYSDNFLMNLRHGSCMTVSSPSSIPSSTRM